MLNWLTVEQTYYAVPLVTLALGLIIGYLAQRSGFCSVGGMRDAMMFKHYRLLYGYIALVGSAAASYALFAKVILPSAFPNWFWATSQADALTPIPGAPGGLTNANYIVLAVIGGFMLGLLGVVLGGCPLRQTVMGSEGNIKSIFFVIGMIIGSILFHLYVAPAVVSWFT